MNSETKIREKLFEKPNKTFHIRLLARETGLNPNTVLNITKKLGKEGFLTRVKDKEKNIVTIKANTDNLIYKTRKKFYNIETIYKSGLVEFIEERLAYPAIVLFGSYAKAENHENSDIDIFIVSADKKKLDLKKYEDKLSTEIQLFVHTKQEWTKLKKTNPELLNNVINGIVISGFLEAF